jgi:glycosyltransferase involved in cell wall biosynthesis
MNVAIPISRFDTSGGIRVLSVLANGLANRGYDVSFVVPLGQHQPFFPLNDRVRIRVIGPDFGNGLVGGLLKKVQLVYGLPAHMDVAIANAFMTAYSVRFGRMIGRTKRGLYFVQGYEPKAFGEYGRGSAWLRAVKTRLAGFTYRLNLECVTNSNWMARAMNENYSTNTTVAPLGVDTKIFHPISASKEKNPDDRFVMTIGNINPVKRFDLFVDAIKIVRTRIDYKMLVASHDPLPRPEGIPAEFASPENDFELAALYNKASIFVSTSASEGFGLPLLEAMACGTPVVTTDSGGIQDFCRDGINCRMVKSARPEDLVAAIMEIYSDKHFANQLIQNGLATAKQWPWDRMIDSFDAVLQRRNTLSPEKEA